MTTGVVVGCIFFSRDQLLLAHCVMTTGVVVGCIFFSRDQLLRVEQLSVCPCPHFIDNSRLQIDHYSPWYVLPGSSFSKKCVERVITSSNSFVRRHLSIRLNTMFQTVKLPTGVPHLHTSLANMNGNALAHIDFVVC